MAAAEMLFDCGRCFRAHGKRFKPRQKGVNIQGRADDTLDDLAERFVFPPDLSQPTIRLDVNRDGLGCHVVPPVRSKHVRVCIITLTPVLRKGLRRLKGALSAVIWQVDPAGDTSLPLAGARLAACRRDLALFGEFEALL
jgi:hypothetical protein